MAAKTGRGVTHEPTDALRQAVSLHASTGTPQELISRILGITEKTLRKHYRDELDLGLAKANAKMAGSLYNDGIKGKTLAQIFWLKTRGGWREQVEAAPTGTQIPFDGWYIERAKPDTPATD